MKRLTTLTGKNLPRLAVAKPGGPTIHRDGLNRQARNPDELPDAGPKVENAQAFQEGITGGHSHLRQVGTPHDEYRITPRAIEDFTRVCDQTGLSEDKTHD